MADLAVAARVRQALSHYDVMEKRSIGGSLAFMLGGHMCVAARKSGLMVRVGPEAYAEALAETHVTPLAMGGRAPLGYVCVEAAGIGTEAELRRWVERGVAFVQTLPAKR